MVCCGDDKDHSFIFEIESKHCISDSFVDYNVYSTSSKGFLPTVVDIMVIWVLFTHSSLSILVRWFLECQCSLLPSPFDHFQFALIHGPDIPGSFAILLFTALHLASITSHIHNWVLFFFDSIRLFFLELFLHWSPVAYWAPADLESSSFSVLSFGFFILFMGFSRQEYWSGLPFPSPVDHILSDLSTMTLPSWLARHSMPHSFIELDKAVVHVIRLVSFLWLWFSICLPSDEEG